MDNSDKQLLLLFEESEYKPSLAFIKDNAKCHLTFRKYIKLCSDFNIKLFEIMDDRYVVRSKEKLIKSCYQKRSDIIEKLAKSINNYNELEKVVISRKVKILLNQDVDKKSESSPEETFDIKAGIDKLYNDFKKDSKLLDNLLEMTVNNFSPDMIQSFYTKKITVIKFIEEYIS
jgi:hypothetical protein